MDVVVAVREGSQASLRQGRRLRPRLGDTKLVIISLIAFYALLHVGQAFWSARLPPSMSGYSADSEAPGVGKNDHDCPWPLPASAYRLPATDRCAPLSVQVSAYAVAAEEHAAAAEAEATGGGASCSHAALVASAGAATRATSDAACTVKLARTLRIRSELNLLHGEFSAEGAELAFQNLRYGNTLPPAPPPAAAASEVQPAAAVDTLLGIRVQYIRGQLYFSAVPPDTRPAVRARPHDRAWLPYTIGTLAMISNAVARHEVPDVDFTVLYGDSCFRLDAHLRDQEHRHLRGASLLTLPPVFSYNTFEDCHAVTFPMFEFAMTDQNYMPGAPWRFDSVPPAERPAWDDRKPVLLFRGGISSWDGIRLRIFRIGLLHGATGLVDIKSSHGACLPDCKERYLAAVGRYGGSVVTPTPRARVESANATDNTADAADDGVRGEAGAEGDAAVQEAVAADCEKICAGGLSPVEQLRYRYHLDADGHGATFRLKNLFLSGSLVFRVESPVSQFFFGDLRPWVHYVPISREELEQDLVSKVRWARENDAEAKRIAERGVRFARRYLTHEAAWWHEAEVLRAFAARQAAPPREPAEGAEPFCCEDLAAPQLQDFHALNLTVLCKQRAPCAARGGGLFWGGRPV